MESLDVRDLLERPGASREVHRRETVPEMGTELASVPAPVAIDVFLENVVEGILVSGPLSGEMSMRCARCLKPFVRRFRIDVHELYAPGATVDDDEYAIREGSIDLEPMVRDAVVLAIPFSPLCREDCLGLCERCGGDRNLGECACGPEADPRWSVLDALMIDEGKE